MKKYDEVDEEVGNLFDEVIDITDLRQQGVNIEVIVDNKQTTVGKVVKANDLTKHLSAGKVDVVIILNENIFIQLPKDMQEMLAVELVTYIGYDTEKDKIIIAKPDVNTFSTILKKYGYESYERLTESIKSLFDTQKNKEGLGGIVE